MFVVRNIAMLERYMCGVLSRRESGGSRARAPVKESMTAQGATNVFAPRGERLRTHPMRPLGPLRPRCPGKQRKNRKNIWKIEIGTLYGSIVVRQMILIDFRSELDMKRTTVQIESSELRMVLDLVLYENQSKDDSGGSTQNNQIRNNL